MTSRDAMNRESSDTPVRVHQKPNRVGSDSRLTPRQRQALTFIRSYQQRHGFPPSTRELAAHMGVVVSGGHAYIQILVRKGVVRKTANTLRTLVVVEK